MKSGRTLLAVTVVIGMALSLMACSGKTRVESDMSIKGAPNWVNEGTHVLKTRDARLFHGVGLAPPMGDQSLQTSTADDRARAELARVLSSYMDVVSQDYSGAAGSGEDAVFQTTVSRQIENVTHLNLAGSRIIARWRDTRTDNIYALAELDMAQVQDTVKGVQDMNTGLREHILREGGNIFDRIAEEKR